MPPSDKPAPKPSRRLGAAILAAGIAGFGLLHLLKPEPQAAPPRDSVPLVEGVPIIWRSGAIEISGSGRVEPVADVELKAQVAGDVVFVDKALQAGGRFIEGQRLVVINPAPYAARVAEFEAQLSRAEADLELAQIQAVRARQIFQRQATSRDDVDQREAALAGARAEVARVRALLDSAAVDLRRTVISAPFNGRVESEQVSIGDVLSPGESFGQIYADDVYQVTVALNESDAALVDGLFATGDTAIDVRVQAPFGTAVFEWPGVVRQIEAGLDTVTRTIDLVVRVENPNKRGTPLAPTQMEAPPLLTGMFATVLIPGRDVGVYAQVPRDALRSDRSLWYVRPDGASRGVIETVPTHTLVTSAARAFVKLALPANSGAVAVYQLPARILPGAEVQIRAAGTAMARADTAPPEPTP